MVLGLGMIRVAWRKILGQGIFTSRVKPRARKDIKQNKGRKKKLCGSAKTHQIGSNFFFNLFKLLVWAGV